MQSLLIRGARAARAPADERAPWRLGLGVRGAGAEQPAKRHGGRPASVSVSVGLCALEQPQEDFSRGREGLKHVVLCAGPLEPVLDLLGVGESLVRLAQPQQAQRQLAVRVCALEDVVRVGSLASGQVDGRDARQAPVDHLLVLPFLRRLERELVAAEALGEVAGVELGMPRVRLHVLPQPQVIELRDDAERLGQVVAGDGPLCGGGVVDGDGEQRKGELRVLAQLPACPERPRLEVGDGAGRRARRGGNLQQRRVGARHHRRERRQAQPERERAPGAVLCQPDAVAHQVKLCQELVARGQLRQLRVLRRRHGRAAGRRPPGERREPLPQVRQLEQARPPGERSVGLRVQRRALGVKRNQCRGERLLRLGHLALQVVPPSHPAL
mmetsp:Transcript_2906/g.9835  ORF Transcript_2906/g.9835 Transcript_2906/m.9835 type:complete len:384 (-) Transcript_2906:5991-7142(-)